MTKQRVLGLAAVAALVAAAAIAWAARPDTQGLAKLEVPEVAQLLAAGDADVVVLDANNASTRAKAGVIPGARLLTSYVDYDAATELPGDRKSQLVFYCYNEWCGAAAEAARKAIASGYRDVSIMPAGIAGWVDAGRAVARVAAEVNPS